MQMALKASICKAFAAKSALKDVTKARPVR